jgi:hypothetical protein
MRESAAASLTGGENFWGRSARAGCDTIWRIPGINTNDGVSLTNETPSKR